MAGIRVTIYGQITHGTDAIPAQCPQCKETESHTVRGDLSDTDVPVTLTCVNGHDVPVPDEIDARELLFTAAMRAE